MKEDFIKKLQIFIKNVKIISGDSVYFNNLKKLRNDKDKTQKSIANLLDIKRSTYNSWERGDVMIPLDIADKLSLYYKVRLSYIYGIDNEYVEKKNIKPINYEKMLDTLLELKKENHQSFADIAESIDCSRSVCHRYFTGLTIPPIDRLVALTKLYKIDLDVLCGKE